VASIDFVMPWHYKIACKVTPLDPNFFTEKFSKKINRFAHFFCQQNKKEDNF
jgi:hypothetical protein